MLDAHSRMLCQQMGSQIPCLRSGAAHSHALQRKRDERLPRSSFELALVNCNSGVTTGRNRPAVLMMDSRQVIECEG